MKKHINLKYVNILLKLIQHLHVNQYKNIIKLKYKKEHLPILIFLKNQNIIYKYTLTGKKNKYVFIFFKFNNNINLLKKIKLFNFKIQNDKKSYILTLIKKNNIFKFYILFNDNGLLSMDDSIKLNKGGFILSQIN
jgi:ribosomal protein S8